MYPRHQNSQDPWFGVCCWDSRCFTRHNESWPSSILIASSARLSEMGAAIEPSPFSAGDIVLPSSGAVPVLPVRHVFCCVRVAAVVVVVVAVVVPVPMAQVDFPSLHFAIELGFSLVAA